MLSGLRVLLFPKYIVSNNYSYTPSPSLSSLLFSSLLAHCLPNCGVYLISYFLNFSRTAGSILGAGFNAFISDWDKISATVSYKFH